MFNQTIPVCDDEKIEYEVFSLYVACMHFLLVVLSFSSATVGLVLTIKKQYQCCCICRYGFYHDCCDNNNNKKLKNEEEIECNMADVH